jgi:hypothetical protein
MTEVGMATLNEKAQQLQQLVSNPSFPKARGELCERIFNICDARLETAESLAKIISSEFDSIHSFGTLDGVFLELVQADLTSLGPVALFLEVPGWSTVTVWGSDRITIKHQDGNESVIDLGFLIPVAPAAISELLSEMRRRWDEQFPILQGQWRQFIVEGAIAPATNDIWFRISTKESLLKEHPMWNF